jgi:hypothetical protein
MSLSEPCQTRLNRSRICGTTSHQLKVFRLVPLIRSIRAFQLEPLASGSCRQIAVLEKPNAPPRTPGTAIYLTQQSELVPAALGLNLKHNGVVHRHVVLLKLTT